MGPRSAGRRQARHELLLSRAADHDTAIRAAGAAAESSGGARSSRAAGRLPAAGLRLVDRHQVEDRHLPGDRRGAVQMSAGIAGLDYWWLKLRAIGALLLGRPRLAEDLFGEMLMRWPTDAYARASRAHVRAQAGRREEALLDARALVEAHPARSAGDWF